MISRTSPWADERVWADGKFLRVANTTWHARGFCYGPFAPNRDGLSLPEPEQLALDLADMRRMGANALRVYEVPSVGLLDVAQEHSLRVLLDVPWDKHRCFFEDRATSREARERVRATASDLGGHPATMAISVVNEIPVDVVRFYGHRRVERFVDELIDIVKQVAPECPATFASFPTTEFLHPTLCDFRLFNVYLKDLDAFGSYLDRLHHVAGDIPLVLGELGSDSLSEGECGQEGLVQALVEQVARSGGAGSFVFQYTDDWFRGGQPVEDWAFGATRRDRSPKPLAHALRRTWAQPTGVSEPDAPSVSVVVCAYNAASTLVDCLEALTRLRYPNLEIILVDDGSTDATPEIAARFEEVTYLRKDNEGLAAARNLGATQATGEVIAYTDADCAPDADWLTYLVGSMARQGVHAIGGPNLTHPDDGPVAQCVGVSRGNPCHVMLDDLRAEHVPGCNMAFRRDELLALGGFDPRFHRAGDDVDICWRFLDAGMSIGFAPAAMVWHHRRESVFAYLRQQVGYGEAEADLLLKYPDRADHFARVSWEGVIYSEKSLHIPFFGPLIYHGPLGSAGFQLVYGHDQAGFATSLMTSFEWHVVVVILLVLGVFAAPPLWIGSLMWVATATVGLLSARSVRLPRDGPGWRRTLLWGLLMLQPVLRGGARVMSRVRGKRLPSFAGPRAPRSTLKRTSDGAYDLHWRSDEGLGREHLLQAFADQAASVGWSGVGGSNWSPWDLWLPGDALYDMTLRTVTEELGQGNRFTRARIAVHPSLMNRSMWFLAGIVGVSATLALGSPAAAIGAVAVGVLLLVTRRRRLRCVSTAASLLTAAAKTAGLGSVGQPSPSTDETGRRVGVGVGVGVSVGTEARAR